MKQYFKSDGKLYANEAKVSTTQSNTGLYFDVSSMQFIKDGQPILQSVGNGYSVGSIVPMYSDPNDEHWLLCDGSQYDTSKYADLYAVLGSNTLPNLTDYGLVGEGSGSNTQLGITDTDSDYKSYQLLSLYQNAIKDHTHNITDNGHSHAGSDAGSHNHRTWYYNGSTSSTWGTSLRDSPRGTSANALNDVIDKAYTGITLNNYGSTETHPASVAMMYFVRG